MYIKRVVNDAIVDYVCDSLNIREPEKIKTVKDQVFMWVADKEFSKPMSFEDKVELTMRGMFIMLLYFAGTALIFKYLI